MRGTGLHEAKVKCDDRTKSFLLDGIYSKNICSMEHIVEWNKPYSTNALSESA